MSKFRKAILSPRTMMLAILATCAPGVSQTPTKITRSVFGNGGTFVSSADQRVVGTLGQVAIGAASDETVVHGAGFWYSDRLVLTSVEPTDESVLPETFQLEQNYPNPFNPSTTIQFSVRVKARVIVRIYDIIGRKVMTLVEDTFQPGTHKAVFEAGQLASGLYIYRIVARETQTNRKLFVSSKKLMLLK